MGGRWVAGEGRGVAGTKTMGSVGAVNEARESDGCGSGVASIQWVGLAGDCLDEELRVVAQQLGRPVEMLRAQLALDVPAPVTCPEVAW